MRKRLGCLLLCLLLCPFAAGAEKGDFGRIVRSYDSQTLKYTVEKFLLENEICYLCRIWVQDPERQIRKATSEWEKDVQKPQAIAKQVPEAALVINGSGFVSPLYPEIPENYPGKSEDYYYTPLGSVTVTDGKVLRNLEGVPYYGLALDADGIRMYAGADNEEVLAAEPVQTWSFYTGCPMMLDNEDILPAEWDFADRKAARTIIAREGKNDYLVLTATRERGKGITLRRAVTFFRENFVTEWVYDLDGGQSTALMCRRKDKNTLRFLYEGGAKIVDIMAFTE